MTTYINHLRGELLAWLEGGELGREAYRAVVIAEAQERGRQRALPSVQTKVAPTRLQAAWTLHKPLRWPGYSRPLYELLRQAHIAGGDMPRTRDVLNAWKLVPPWGIQVEPDGIKFVDANGNLRPADLHAIGAAINRMTTPKRTVSAR